MLRISIAGVNPADMRLRFRQGTRFIEDNGVDLVQEVKGPSVFNEQSFVRCQLEKIQDTNGSNDRGAVTWHCKEETRSSLRAQNR